MQEYVKPEMEVVLLEKEENLIITSGCDNYCDNDCVCYGNPA